MSENNLNLTKAEAQLLIDQLSFSLDAAIIDFAEKSPIRDEELAPIIKTIDRLLSRAIEIRIEATGTIKFRPEDVVVLVEQLGIRLTEIREWLSIRDELKVSDAEVARTERTISDIEALIEKVEKQRKELI